MILAILLSLFSITINDVSAQTLTTITIWPDGSVDPSSCIQRDGNTYVLTTDLNLPIEIQKDSIILDGSNHKLEATRGNYGSAAITLKASNVIITNFHIAGWTAGIYGAYNNNTISGNEFTDNSRAIALYATDYVISKNIIQTSNSGIYIKDVLPSTKSNNLIISNQIINNYYAFHIINGNRTTITQNNVKGNNVILCISGGQNGKYTDAGYHLIYRNNFVDNKQALYVPPMTNGPILSQYNPVSPAGNWDNGKTGNYWSDYTTRYPNASKISISGIGNTPYLIEGYLFESEYLLGLGVDHYPLTNAYDRSGRFNAGYIAVAILVLAVLVTVLVTIIYRKNRRKN
jgi:hypothetical protein